MTSRDNDQNIHQPEGLTYFDETIVANNNIEEATDLTNVELLADQTSRIDTIRIKLQETFGGESFDSDLLWGLTPDVWRAGPEILCCIGGIGLALCGCLDANGYEVGGGLVAASYFIAKAIITSR